MVALTVACLLMCYPSTVNSFLFHGSRRVQESLRMGMQNVDDYIVPTTGVTLKVAFDEQWAVADMSCEKSERFTCEQSLDLVHRLRRCSDAVLVGRSTVEADDCSLTVRRVALGSSKQPVRVVLDPRRQLDLERFQITKDGLPTIIIHRDEIADVGASEFPNVTLIGLAADKEGLLSSKEITQTLRSNHGIKHLMVEGGPATATSFLDEGVVDRAIIIHAPIKFRVPLESGMTISTLEEAGLKLVGEHTLGVDRISYWSRPGLPWPASNVTSWP